jgi:hypothetical protein
MMSVLRKERDMSEEWKVASNRNSVTSSNLVFFTSSSLSERIYIPYSYGKNEILRLHFAIAVFRSG